MVFHHVDHLTDSNSLVLIVSPGVGEDEPNSLTSSSDVVMSKLDVGHVWCRGPRVFVQVKG